MQENGFFRGLFFFFSFWFFIFFLGLFIFYCSTSNEIQFTKYFDYYSPPSSEEVLGPAANEPYYYGKITRSDADTQLNDRGEEGDFLLRDSESNVSFFYAFNVENFSI